MKFKCTISKVQNSIICRLEKAQGGMPNRWRCGFLETDFFDDKIFTRCISFAHPFTHRVYDKNSHFGMRFVWIVQCTYEQYNSMGPVQFQHNGCRRMCSRCSVCLILCVHVYWLCRSVHTLDAHTRRHLLRQKNVCSKHFTGHSLKLNDLKLSKHPFKQNVCVRVCECKRQRTRWHQQKHLHHWVVLYTCTHSYVLFLAIASVSTLYC